MQILDVGWPELHAPPLDKVCTICKAQESWLNSDPQHVVVIHCRVSLSLGQQLPRALGWVLQTCPSQNAPPGLPSV